jgi:UPF0755 protein
MRPGIKVFSSLLLVAGLGGLAFQLLNQPIGESSRARIVEIPKGTSFKRIAARLQKENLIAHKWFFSGIARMKGEDRKIIPGEYELHAGMRPTEILSKLVEGKRYYHTVTIPEGYTIEQIANLLAAKELTDRIAFLQLTRDPDMIHSLNLKAPTLEGYLFPDTYFFARPISADAIIRTLVRRFWEVFAPAYLARTRDLDMTVQEVLTLASVIEKETGLSQERSLVSGVFHNRLRKKIPLQSDPTVIYALKDFDGNIRKEDLLVESPYNTYLVVGLPPGPIANPGEEAIRAALFPTPTDFVYFVSRNDGSHEFSSTLAEHNQAVEKYQRSGKKQAS